MEKLNLKPPTHFAIAFAPGIPRTIGRPTIMVEYATMISSDLTFTLTISGRFAAVSNCARGACCLRRSGGWSRRSQIQSRTTYV